MSSNTSKTTLTIKSSTHNLKKVENFLLNLKKQLNITDELYMNIVIAVTEAVNNAIIHGNKSMPRKRVSIDVKLLDSFCAFTVEDEGSGFNYKGIHDPTMPQNISKAGGRGIFFMKQLCTMLQFDKQGRSVRLFFKLDNRKN